MVAMGADELAVAFHAPVATRSELSNIWNDALHDNDDEEDGNNNNNNSSSSSSDDVEMHHAVAVSPSSSSAASSTSSPAQPPQQPQSQQSMLAPGPSFFYSTASGTGAGNLGELGAFFATQPHAAAMASASSAHMSSATALNSNFLDDLLSSDDMDFRVRGGAVTVSTPSSASSPFLHTTSLPPSIQQTLLAQQRQLASAPAFGSMSDSQYMASTAESAALDGSAALSSSTASRLLQLENNYERKKKRAKINRKDLNARFQELMDILSLKEDRKLNRAKILEKTIEYIERLEDEVHALRARSGVKSAAPASASAPTAFANLPQRQAAPMMLANPRGSHSLGGGAPLMAFDTASAHAWTAAAAAAAAAGASNLPIAPMMWLPCPMVPPPPPATNSAGVRMRSDKRPPPSRASAPSKAAPAVVESRDDAHAAETAPRSLKRARDSSSSSSSSSAVASTSCSAVPPAVLAARQATGDSLFVWSAQEIPALLAFCDAWTLMRVMQTSRDLAGMARQSALWAELSRRRWRLSWTPAVQDAREQWTRLHHEMHMPACGTISSNAIRFASGRAQGVHAWGLLARRSNSRTTRTVLLGGKATVMQVVELYVVVQNMGPRKVRLTDAVAVRAGDSYRFEPFTSGSGAHLTPHVVSFNDSVCATRDLAGVELLHGDVCTLAVFLQCPGLDLEQEFLQRAECLDVHCDVVAASSASLERVCVRAHCVDDAHKKQLLDTHYSSMDEGV